MKKRLDDHFREQQYDDVETSSYIDHQRQKIRRALDGAYDEHDPEASIKDCLTDLRHLCDELGLDFAALDRSAYHHYTEEKAL